ncbi:4Fe-4S dicluster domain-containing protein [Petrocella sp. FN5]|uniref:4Fe-4S dicluster domain-containing protein n=1 Tax=Petrocella sp. FN5 TaxID=3032002 RepID=UPI0023DBF731|nr:reductive dehalogenase domain-containing protein [Petrocella sp. FN5]MDF1618419.1 reductive dehalogenase domain-containing protein [Petrocella sp. FN5]
MKKVDERDIIFSRMNIIQGSPIYDEYYLQRPELKLQDDILRSLPHMGTKEGKIYNRLDSPIVDASFHFLNDMKDLSDGIRNPVKVEVDPELITKKIKGLAKYYNAKLIGVAQMKEDHYYSHRGRRSELYGEKVDATHQYGIVFAVEMEQEMIFKAPLLPEEVAVTKGYIDAAIIGMVLSYYIRELGYSARNHMDGNYLMVAPLVAQDAGLGEIGRNGLLSTKKYGPRIRLGVVTTDLPLVADEKIDFGLKELCSICKNCAKTCPAKAIHSGESSDVDGQKVWKINPENCYKRWRQLGTDCGICLASCPLSTTVSEGLIDQMKESGQAREEILKQFHANHQFRGYNKNKISWLE